MKFLGHRDIRNTLIYIDLEIACYPNSIDNYVSKVAKTEQEICSCIEPGFEYFVRLPRREDIQEATMKKPAICSKVLLFARVKKKWRHFDYLPHNSSFLCLS